MADINDHSAMHRALLLPEILSMIFAWIAADNAFYFISHIEDDSENEIDEVDSAESKPSLPSYGAKGVLARCAQVSHLWFSEAIPFLWSDPDNLGVTEGLADSFAFVERPRRQIYADWVQSTVARTCPEGEGEDGLRDLEFPRLGRLRLMISTRHHWSSMDDESKAYRIPRIRAPQLLELEIDPPFDIHPPDTYGVDPNDWDSILDQVPVCSL
jgi:hypothetical protein